MDVLLQREGIFSRGEELALTLLVARVFADHEYVALAANHLALIADPLDARLDLHGFPLRCLQIVL
jgi:hypothetical protein